MPSRRLLVIVAGAAVVVVAGSVAAFAAWSSRQAPRVALHATATAFPTASASSDLGNPFGVNSTNNPSASPTSPQAATSPTAPAANGLPPPTSGTPNPNQAMMGTDADGRPILASSEGVPGHETQPGGAMTSTWEWDGSRWKWLRSDPQTDKGGKLVYHPALRKVVELAGGITGSPYTMWGFDASGWAQLLPATVPSPGQGIALLAVDYARHGLLALVPESETSSTWTFDGVTWTKVATAINLPGRRRAMAYDPDSSMVVTFGGGINGLLDDTWTWDGTTWTDKHPATTPGGCAVDQLAYDAAIRQMILFCQRPTGVTLWAWTGTTWTQLHPSTMPPATWDPMMTYDAVRGELVYFGQPQGSPGSQTWTYADGNWKKAA